ncbi:mucin-7-like [Homarus americanus]|uniref:mucin-7-like n=1 Tax=Homarus americanus TaxID=6706 RepID=UPI001C453F40|nr:mucin-7-like [Homarus americanus]
MWTPPTFSGSSFSTAGRQPPVPPDTRAPPPSPGGTRISVPRWCFATEAPWGETALPRTTVRGPPLRLLSRPPGSPPLSALDVWALCSASPRPSGSRVLTPPVATVTTPGVPPSPPPTGTTAPGRLRTVAGSEVDPQGGRSVFLARSAAASAAAGPGPSNQLPVVRRSRLPPRTPQCSQSPAQPKWAGSSQRLLDYSDSDQESASQVAQATLTKDTMERQQAALAFSTMAGLAQLNAWLKALADNRNYLHPDSAFGVYKALSTQTRLRLGY